MVSFSRVIIAIAASLMAGTSSALELTTENFAEKVTGKTVFIKFFAPWCGHCKAMAEDWAKLEEDFKDHPVALVGSVDCTEEESTDLCELFQVEVGCVDQFPCDNDDDDDKNDGENDKIELFRHPIILL